MVVSKVTTVWSLIMLLLNVTSELEEMRKEAVVSFFGL
jgi:hypothetical protein